MRLALVFWGAVALALYFAASLAVIDAGSIENLSWRWDAMIEDVAR